MTRSTLFLCVANSARCRMGEGIARQMFPDLRIQNVGSRPSHLDLYAIEVLVEKGIDATTHSSKSVETIDPASMDLISTLCADEVCPPLLGRAERLHWPVPDLASDDPSLTLGDLRA